MKIAIKELGICHIEDADAAALRLLWLEMNGCRPPKTFTARLMRHALAWKIQAAVKGGETSKLKRAWKTVEKARVSQKRIPLQSVPGLPKPQEGTRILREWGGKTHEMTVVEDGGVLWNGERYSSLSAVARAMTGTNRNGPKFFGLRKEASA